jgi:putative transposase
MDTSVHHTAHSAYQLHYHLVWTPRYRKKILFEPLESRLKAIFNEVAEKYSFRVLAVEVMPDHVHLFVGAPPKYSPSELIRLFKGTSSRLLGKEFPEIIRHHYWGKNATLWSEGYYAGTAGNVSAEIIRRYIEECQGK